MARQVLSSITLNRTLAVSLQDQLTMGLRLRIQSAVLKPGEMLPSSRDLANDLGVSRNTVIGAYDRLLGEGYLESQPRSGISVSSELLDSSPGIPSRAHQPARHTQLSSASKQTIKGPVPFRPSQPDVRLFPLSTWNRLRNRVLRRHGYPLLDYQSPFALGWPPLRKALAAYLHTSRGVRCDWEQIAITSGSQQALFMLSELLLKPGDKVFLEDPGYLGARNAFIRAGAKLTRLPIDGQGAQPPVRINKSRLIYTTPSRQYPTGACLPLARRLALLNVAQRAHAWLLEDDYDSEFRYARPPMPSLQSLDTTGRVIYLGSMSKVLFPSLRIGYVVLPCELIQPFEQLRLILDDHGPLVDQAVLAEFIATGNFYTHIRRCRKAYASRLQVFLKAAELHQWPLHFPFIDGGMNQTGYFTDPSVDDEQCSQALSKLGFYVPALNKFSIKKTAPGLVFGFTAFTEATIREAAAKVGQVLLNQGKTSD